MELKDMVLKKGDVVYFEDDTAILQFDWENNLTIEEWNKARHSNKQIIKIERPRYETIYEVPQQILDEEEKEWLENFLGPFKNKRVIIVRHNTIYGDYIHILIGDEDFELPYFEKDTMYKGMEPGKEYTLDELGLFKENAVYPLTADYKEELTNQMKRIVERNKDERGECYPESTHIEADKLLCEVLEKEGYDKLVEWFKNLEKWYS